MKSKKIILAKNIGFCFGVDRALKIAKQNSPIFTLGSIIHNEYVVNELLKKYKIMINLNPPKESKILLRAHGISLQKIIELKRKKCYIIDATCPFVNKIHNIVQHESEYNRNIIILGLAVHPEIIGICGWIYKSKYSVFLNTSELNDNINKIFNLPITIVVQTTFDKKTWFDFIKIIKNKCKNYKIFNTICSATFKRQNEVKNLSHKCDTIFILGDKSSSNSTKLYKIALPLYKQTVYISSDDFDRNDIHRIISNSNNNIAIASGASTSKKVINDFVLLANDIISNY